MTYLTSFSENKRPYQGIGSWVLHQPVAFNRAQGPVVYWLAALADFGPGRAQGLLPEVPATRLINYFLRPAGLVANQEQAALSRPLAPAPLTAEQRRNYLLDHQQAAYEELEASRSMRSQLPLPLAEITRDLAGWTTPQGPLASKPAATPKPEKKAPVKRRHA